MNFGSSVRKRVRRVLAVCCATFHITWVLTWVPTKFQPGFQPGFQPVFQASHPLKTPLNLLKASLNTLYHPFFSFALRHNKGGVRFFIIPFNLGSNPNLGSNLGSNLGFNLGFNLGSNLGKPSLNLLKASLNTLYHPFFLPGGKNSVQPRV